MADPDVTRLEREVEALRFQLRRANGRIDDLAGSVTKLAETLRREREGRDSPTRTTRAIRQAEVAARGVR